MSWEAKITKLCRAVRAYRGIAHGKDPQGKTIWSQMPQPNQRKRVVELLQKIGLGAEELKKIDQFKTFDEFNQWVKTLR